MDPIIFKWVRGQLIIFVFRGTFFGSVVQNYYAFLTAQVWNFRWDPPTHLSLEPSSGSEISKCLYATEILFWYYFVWAIESLFYYSTRKLSLPWLRIYYSVSIPPFVWVICSTLPFATPLFRQYLSILHGVVRSNSIIIVIHFRHRLLLLYVEIVRVRVLHIRQEYIFRAVIWLTHIGVGIGCASLTSHVKGICRSPWRAHPICSPNRIYVILIV